MNEIFMKPPELIGDYYKRNGRWHAMYKCACGKIFGTDIRSVKSGDTKSCGCYRHKAKTHGKYGTKIYTIWNNMLDRCTNSNNKDYDNYGGRGIIVCDEWYSFENFYKYMGDPPNNTSLDRRDNNGNYCKDNCRWATASQQVQNRRDNVYLTNNVGETKLLVEWSKIVNVSIGTLRSRKSLGWSDNEILYGKN